MPAVVFVLFPTVTDCRRTRSRTRSATKFYSSVISSWPFEFAVDATGLMLSSSARRGAATLRTGWSARPPHATVCCTPPLCVPGPRPRSPLAVLQQARGQDREGGCAALERGARGAGRACARATSFITSCSRLGRATMQGACCAQGSLVSRGRRPVLRGRWVVGRMRDGASR